MTINIWTGNKARVDTRKVGKDRFDAVIYPDGNDDPEKAQTLIDALRQSGYDVLPGPIPQAPTHTLNISGFRDAADKTRTIASIRQYVDLLHLKIHESANGFQVTGFSHQGQVEEVWRTISGPWYESRKDIKVKHELHENPPLMGIAVHGVSDEKTLFSLVERNGWASGERQDEYHGMSAFGKQWAMMVKNASKYASFMYMLGEGQVLLSIVIDAARQKISPLKHKGIMEPIGYLAGSATMFAGALLREPATVDQVVDRFDKNFQVGGDHDYEGKAEGFGPDGKDMGRGAFTIKEAFKHNGTEILMFLNTVAAAGVWNGRYRQIMQVSEPNRDGIRSAELNDDGTSKKTEKLAVKNAISGIMLGFGTLMYALLPKIGREDLFLKYQPMLDTALNIPVLGQALKLVGYASDTTVGNAVLYVPRKIIGWLRSDTTQIASKMFQTHNVGQLVFGTLDVISANKELAALSEQFDKELNALLQDPPRLFVPKGDFFKDKIIEAKDVATELRDIYDHKDSKNPDETYKRFIRDFLDDEGNPRADKMADPKAVFLFEKALNRQYLEELRKEIKSFGWKLSGNLTAFTAAFAMGHTGDDHRGLVNVTEAMVNPFAVCDGIVKRLHDDNAATPTAAARAAKWLYQDEAMRPFGFSEQDYKDILTAKIEGIASPKEKELWNSSLWLKPAQSAVATDTATATVTESSHLLDRQETRTDQLNPAWRVTPRNANGHAAGMESGKITPEKVLVSDGSALQPTH